MNLAKRWSRFGWGMMVAIMLWSMIGIVGVQGAASATGLPKPDHTVIVVMENHSFTSVIGSAKAPHINYLAKVGALFTKAYANEHPSQPNYLDLFSGSNQGVKDDSCPHTFSAPNLASELLKANLSFAGYSEDMPSVGYTGCTVKQYFRKHNPWVNFDNVPASLNKPLTDWPSDFSKLPTISFVIPNQDNDMHDGTIEQADKWLETKLQAYEEWALSNNSLLIVTWDEDDYSKDNQVPIIMYGPMVKPGNTIEPITHFNVLRTLTDMYGLTAMGGAATVEPIKSIWVDPNDTQKPTAPTGISVTHRTKQVVDLAWVAGTDNNRINSYEVFRNGVLVGKTTKTVLVDSSVPLDGEAFYTVVSIDAAGNRSDASQVYTLPKWPIDGALTATIYYRSSDSQWIHYQPDGGTWTELPGFQMVESPIKGYQYVQVWTGTAKGIAGAAFHNADNVWDSNNNKNFVIPNGVYTLENGVLKMGAPSNAVSEPAVTIYYAASVPTNIHYHIDGGVWTTSPGVKMSETNLNNFQTFKILLGSSGKQVEAAFNDGTKWDSQNMLNYKFTAGVYTVKNTLITPGAPDGIILPPDPTPSPTPVPSIIPSPTISVEPSPTATVFASPIPSPSPSASVLPTVTPSPTPEPTATPSPTPIPTATPTLEPTPTPTATPTIVPTATPAPTKKPTIKVTAYYKSANKVTVNYRINKGPWMKSTIAMVKSMDFKGYVALQWLVPTAQSYIDVTFMDGKKLDNNKGKGYRLYVGSNAVAKGKAIKGVPVK